MKQRMVEPLPRAQALAAIKRRWATYHELPLGFDRMTPDKAYLLGVLCGDGCVTKHKESGTLYFQLNVVSDAVPFVDAVRQAFRNVYGVTPHTAVYHYPEVKGFASPSVRKPQMRLSIGHQTAVTDLLSYFSVWPTSHSWDVPQAVMEANPDAQGMFLAGLLDSDGWIKPPPDRVVMIVSVCKAGLISVQRMLAQHQIVSHINQKRNKHIWTWSTSRSAFYAWMLQFGSLALPYKQQALLASSSLSL